MDVYGKIDPNRIHKMANSHSFYQNTYIPWDTLSTYSRFYFTMLLTCTIVSRRLQKMLSVFTLSPFLLYSQFLYDLLDGVVLLDGVDIQPLQFDH